MFAIFFRFRSCKVNIIVKENGIYILAFFFSRCKIEIITGGLPVKSKEKGEISHVIFTQGKRPGSC